MGKRRVIDALRKEHGGTWSYEQWVWTQKETGRTVATFSSCMCDEPCSHIPTLRWTDTHEFALSAAWYGAARLLGGPQHGA